MGDWLDEVSCAVLDSKYLPVIWKDHVLHVLLKSTVVMALRNCF